ncbi:uncharacterized protein LOC129941196 [Eupeodes corollae]|uniref:uncharacterized protein LOC129941196 n=1 Tax=Eupeodes corollae TaxID=290404 RepID=UPI00249148B6|nr:uncharacterized protein LOC129941196 [Eupeodes corollae]
MLTFKSFTFILILKIILSNYNLKLRELIIQIHGKSDTATVFFIEAESEFLTEFMRANTIIPASIFDSSEALSRPGQSNNVIIVYQVPDDAESHNSSQALQSAIKNIPVRKFVIVAAENLDILRQYFEFFTIHKFRRIFGIIANSSSYAYMPFADHPIQELLQGSCYLPDALKDLNGFAVRTTVQIDLPRAFWYPTKSGEKRIAGRFGQIFLQFLRKHNSSFEEMLINNSSRFDLDAVFNATLNEEVDISMNSFFPGKQLEMSYPVIVEKTVIMVPYNGFLHPSEYFLRPFSTTTWTAIGVSFVFIVIAKVLLDLFTDKGVDFWSSFSFTYLTMLSAPTERPVEPLYYRLHLLVLLFAFIMGTMFLSYFQSYLTVYISIKQFDTVQDLMDHRISVMISSYRWDSIKDDPLPLGLTQIILPIHPTLFIPKLVSMRDNNFAYIIEDDRCKFYIGLQSSYRKSLFRRAQQTVNSYFIGFVLPFHSPFKEILNNFIVEIWQTGLIQKWDSDVIYQAKAANYRLNMYTKKDDNNDVGNHCVQLNLRHLHFAWKCLRIGLFMATVVFILELFYTWCLKKNIL